MSRILSFASSADFLMVVLSEMNPKGLLANILVDPETKEEHKLKNELISYRYSRGEKLLTTINDAKGIAYLINFLITRANFQMERIHFKSPIQYTDWTFHSFFLGSPLTNNCTSGAIKRTNSPIRFVIEERGQQRLILDTPLAKREWSVSEDKDFGLLAKFVDRYKGKYYFILAGLGPIATSGCCYYLDKYCSNIENDYSDDFFWIIIEVDRSSDHTSAREIYILKSYNAEITTAKNNYLSIPSITKKEGKKMDIGDFGKEVVIETLKEAIKFGFERLKGDFSFWKKKGKSAGPTGEPMIEGSVLKIDDIEINIKESTLKLKEERIKALMDLITKNERVKSSFEVDLTNPDLSPTQRASIKRSLPDVESEINKWQKELDDIISEICGE